MTDLYHDTNPISYISMKTCKNIRLNQTQIY